MKKTIREIIITIGLIAGVPFTAGFFAYKGAVSAGHKPVEVYNLYLGESND